MHWTESGDQLIAGGSSMPMRLVCLLLLIVLAIMAGAQLPRVARLLRERRGKPRKRRKPFHLRRLLRPRVLWQAAAVVLISPLALGLLVFLVFGAFLAHDSSVVVDRSEGAVTLTRTTWFGCTRTVVPFGEIRSVETRVWQPTGSRYEPPNSTHRVVLILADGRELLMPGAMEGASHAEATAEAAARRLREFMDLPQSLP